MRWLNWLHVVPPSWWHDGAQSALAAAVVMLGLVILLELRSVVQLRRSVDRSLARVFEQLDLLRFENQQVLEEQTRTVLVAAPANAATAVARVATPAGAPATPAAEGAAQAAERGALPSGEARLLASLAEARARRQGSATR